MNWIKVIIINVLVLFSLLFLLIVSPPILWSMWEVLRPQLDAIDERVNLPIYDDKQWAKTHFNEFKFLHTKYQDFIIWRREDINKSTINITNGLRHTTTPDKVIRNDEFWFFGGSSTWGTGVEDANTYPSKFAIANKVKTVNFGETGYIARQSLAMLLNQYSVSDNQKKRTVVFYSGSNDVAIRCRANNDGSSSSREAQIQNKIYLNKKWKFSRTFDQLFEFFNLVSKKIGIGIVDSTKWQYLCDIDSERSEHVAKTLISNWLQAKAVAEANGDKFVAVLQPVAFIGRPKVDYLGLRSVGLGKQFKVVYSLIKKYAIAADLKFIDLTNVYDKCNNCYIDYSHVSAHAHDLLVRKLSSELFN